MASPGGSSGGTYIRGGRVVSSDDVSFGEHLTHLGNLAVFFFTSIFSTAPIREQVDKFNGSRTRSFGGSSNVNSGSGGGGQPYQRRSNVNTFGPAPTSGCSGGS
jgi:hypothetical protein